MRERPMVIEGEPGKRFRIYRAKPDGEMLDCIAEYDTIDEVLAHRWRPDWHYKIGAGGKYLDKIQFQEWARAQRAKSSSPQD